MQSAKPIVEFMAAHGLCLVTAESCTAGRIVSLLAEVEGSGSLLDCSYVVYSPEAKKRLLGVRQETIDRYNLTSEQVAAEMAVGALRESPANVAVASTGLAGKEGKDGIPPGTLCFAWAFLRGDEERVVTETRRFTGTRSQIQEQGSLYALAGIERHYRAVGKKRSNFASRRAVLLVDRFGG